MILEWTKLTESTLPPYNSLCLIVVNGTRQNQVWYFDRKDRDGVWFQEEEDMPDYWFTYEGENLDQIDWKQVSHYMLLPEFSEA